MKGNKKGADRCLNCPLVHGYCMDTRVSYNPAFRNPFDSQGFTMFWLRVEREWAETAKKLLYYPASPCDFYTSPEWVDCENNSDPKEEPCAFGFSEECVEPQLRNTACCFECWLYEEKLKEKT